MSTKINTLELYVNGVQAFPNNEAKPELEVAAGYWPTALDDAATLTANLKAHPTNRLNFNLWYDWYRSDNTWYNYWQYKLLGEINKNTPIVWPEYTQSEISSLTGIPYDLGGPDCISYPNAIKLANGIFDLSKPYTGVSYDVIGSGASKEYILDRYYHLYGLQNNRCTSLTFDPTSLIPVHDEGNNYQAVYLEYSQMFKDCKALETITGLNLSNLNMSFIDDGHIYSTMYGMEYFFYNCQNLKTLTNCDFPQTFTGYKYAYTFYNCVELPIHTAVGSIVFDNPGVNDQQNQIYINCEHMFEKCKRTINQILDPGSMEYVNNLKCAWADSGVQYITIPDHMPTGTDLRFCVTGCTNLRSLVIESTGLCNAEFYDSFAYNGSDTWLGTNQLFSPFTIVNMHADFKVYVPDAEIDTWRQIHGAEQEGDEQWKQLCYTVFHGLSELND